MIGAQQFTIDDARILVVACFHDLAQEVDGGRICKSSEPEAEIAQSGATIPRRRCHGSPIRKAETAGFGGVTRHRAEELLSEQGRSLGQLSPELQLALQSGVARAFAECERLFLYRLDERLLPYEPADPIFRSAVNCTELSRPSTSDDLVARAVQIGPSVSELVDHYLVSKRKEWTPKTLKGRTSQLKYLVDHLGKDTPASKVSASQIREFRDAVSRLRSSHHAGPGSTFQARQTENEAQRVAPKTAAVIFETAKACFRWAKSEAFIHANPAADIRVAMPKVVKGKRSRTPFTAEQLKTLFSAPVFSGCTSARRRFEPGKVVVKDAYFWVPLIGYYTGARLGEIVQLHVADVHLEGGVPYIDITEAGGESRESGDHKHVKSQAQVRQVPLQSRPDEVGVRRVREAAPEDKRKFQRLFWEVGYGADGQPSQCSRSGSLHLLDRVGLADPTLVFHSFRHGAQDAFRDALAPQYLIDKVIGHADGATSAIYGEAAGGNCRCGQQDALEGGCSGAAR